MSSIASRFKIGPSTAGLLCLLLAALAAWASYYTASRVAHLQRVGVIARGTVVDIHVGVKGLRSAVVRYSAAGGDDVVGRDLHKTQFIDPNDVGDEVTLRFDPSEPQSILIDRHGWEWLNAGMLALGGVLCTILAFVLVRSTKA